MSEQRFQDMMLNMAISRAIGELESARQTLYQTPMHGSEDYNKETDKTLADIISELKELI